MTTTSRFHDRKVGDIAARLPGATALFRRHKIDFCCGGGVSLGEAAAKLGVDVAELDSALADLAIKTPDAPQESAQLVAHILTRYHETHRRELPELARLARRVEAVHRDHAQALAGLAEMIDRATVDLGSHMNKEEQILFPAMQTGYQGSLDMPIRVMRHEHNQHAEIIRGLETLTQGFAPPDDACCSWQALYTGVEKFVTDLTEHIHLENNILFPRFEKRWGRA